jgi:hypothetical protein
VPAVLFTALLLVAQGQVDAPSAAPLDEQEALRRGCELLLAAQEGEGRREWPYEGVYRVPEPGSADRVIPMGYRVGGTAIACLALVAAPGYSDEGGAGRRAAVARGLEFVLEALAHPLMEAVPVASYDVRGWGFVYALALLVDLEQRGLVPSDLAQEAADTIPYLVRALEDTALEAGGWNYAGRVTPAPFMTAPALQALLAARTAGQAVDDEVLERALDSLERGRARSGSIAYSTPAESRGGTAEESLGFMDLLPGATGRMLATEVTLQLFERGDARRLSRAVAAFFEHWEQLERRRKQTGTHVQPYGVAPYYVIYAHFHAAQAIELLVDETERARQRKRLVELLAGIREPSGGWNDRVFPRSEAFGTAMVMLALQQPELARR